MTVLAARAVALAEVLGRGRQDDLATAGRRPGLIHQGGGQGLAHVLVVDLLQRMVQGIVEMDAVGQHEIDLHGGDLDREPPPRR